MGAQNKRHGWWSSSCVRVVTQLGTAEKSVNVRTGEFTNRVRDFHWTAPLNPRQYAIFTEHRVIIY